MLSEIKIAEMLRADRTRITAALLGAGELKAHHQRTRAIGQRRYTLTMVCTLTGPESDPLKEGEAVLRSRLPDAVLEMSKLWEDDDGQLKVAYTFTPAPSTDQIVLVTIEKANFSSLKDAGSFLAQLPADRLVCVDICFRSTTMQTVSPIRLQVLGGSVEQDLRLILLGRNIY